MWGKMAHKGDFPECNRCTSFQCRTCGLDSGVFKEEGSVSSGNSLIKTNVISIILLILSEFIDKKPINPVYLFIIVGLAVNAIRYLLIHRAMKEKNSNDGEADNYYGKAVLMDIIAFIILMIGLFTQD